MYFSPKSLVKAQKKVTRALKQALVVMRAMPFFKKYVSSCLLFFFLASCTTPDTEKVSYPELPCLIPDSGYAFKTCRPFPIIIDKKTYVIPEGFKTDLASIPRILWFTWSPNYVPFISPAIVHDFFYSCDEDVNRADADRTFYYSLLHFGVGNYTAYFFWLTLRLFGWTAYHEGDTCTERYIETKVPYQKPRP